ncbi:hypothetical protein F5Y18DRAFT_393912 [Xylariaceae sp. FL1019]|nr:hypothetical protein F5Y18DRAFT_393912 [Xylariaceae sp. FL1019]
MFGRWCERSERHVEWCMQTDTSLISSRCMETLTTRKTKLVENATLSLTSRSGPDLKGMPDFIGNVNRDKGEIMVTASGAYIHSDSYKKSNRQ